MIVITNNVIPILRFFCIKTAKTSPKKIKVKLIEQIYKPVRWLDTINSMLKMKVNTIIECGPSKVLCGLIKRISPETETIDLDSFDNYVNLSNEKRA